MDQPYFVANHMNAFLDCGHNVMEWNGSQPKAGSESPKIYKSRPQK